MTTNLFADASHAGICRAAADRLDDSNWGQGVVAAANGRLCALVHLKRAAADQQAEEGEHVIISMRLRNTTMLTLGAYLHVWNDTKGREWRDVARMFREAADIFEREDRVK